MADCETRPGWTLRNRRRAAQVAVRLAEELGESVAPRIRWIAEGGEVQAAGASAPAEPAASSGELG
ncbi:hypothetical protein [Tomitella gaofuii]|uniref:hypothetical protein n=1 Tax=Tomitella gaofuii TaxID=2760083 RepID=UPI0015FA03F0|nr:hypothetical protein [Tomitella gaofuii]